MKKFVGLPPFLTLKFEMNTVICNGTYFNLDKHNIFSKLLGMGAQLALGHKSVTNVSMRYIWR